MTMSEWHVPSDSFADYRAERAGPISAASLEAHLLHCADCRTALAETTDQVAQASRWAAIVDEIDRPTYRLVDVPWWVRITVGAPSLMRAAAALFAVLVGLPLALAIESPRAAVAAFLSIAPIVPLVGATLAYRSSVDPAGTLAAATPMASLPVMLVRSLVVFAAAVPVAFATAALLPVPIHLLVGWLLPGLAFSAIVLAAGTRFDPAPLACALAIAWVGIVVSTVRRLGDVRLEQGLGDMFVNQPALQAGLLALAAVAGGLYWSRRNLLSPWSTS